MRVSLAVIAFLLSVLSIHRAARAQCTEGWTALTEGLNLPVRAVAVLPGNGSDIIVGGDFTIAGAAAAGRIARHNLTTGAWSVLGSGVNGTVWELAVLPNGDVIVGGDFTTAGGVAASRIARYNPTTSVWSALGSGTSGTVHALVVLPDGDLVVGGRFTTAGGVAANRIARYNPTTGVWSALGTGASDIILDLCLLPDGDLLAGGIFGIARVNPTTNVWSALGSGTNDLVWSLAVVQGGEVIVGGNFSLAGGIPTNYIARVNPNTGIWTGLGSGVNGAVLKLAALPGGDVIAGGVFNTAGGVAARHVARYNTTVGAWSSLGSGTDWEVNTVAVLPDGDVIAGGVFAFAGDAQAKHIARYTFVTTPAPTISAPLGSSVCPGQPISLLATAPGATSYQWLKDLSEIPGATQANLEISSAVSTDGGVYSVRATFPCGTLTSDPLEVRVANARPVTTSYFDSQTQYSGTQGQNGWEYGFYDGDAGVAFTPADFEPLPIFAPLPPPYGDNITPIWHRHPLNYWTQIGSSLVHPNGVAAGRIPEVNWAVHRWTCPSGFSARPVSVRIDVSDTQETCGDGVTVAFNKYSLPILNQTVPPTESRTTILSDCLTPGDVYSLAIGPGNSGNEQCDTFNSRLRIGTPFLDEPTSAALCRNQPVTFGLRVPSNIPVQYQWRHDSIPIDPASNPSATTAFLHISQVTTQTTGEYDCVVTFPCGTATCDPVELDLCGGDFNCDSVVDFFDYLDFVDAFSAQLPAADFNEDSVIDFFDYLDFVDAFSAGC